VAESLVMPKRALSPSTRKKRSAPKGARAPSRSESFPIAGIGASAGGFESISILLKNIRPDTGLALVIVQHLSPTPHSELANLLVKTTRMPVVEVQDGMPVEPNHVYVLTPNYDVILEKRRLRLVSRPGSERVHMPIDHFFQSLATEEKERAIGVVLSGTGTDGTLGLRAIKEADGLTYAESDATAKYFAMPNSAILAGCVDAVRSAKDIAEELGGIVRHPYVREKPIPDAQEVSFGGFPEKADALTKLFYIVRQRTGVNFANYKHTTIRRRIARRMIFKQIDKLDDYVKSLRSDAKEVDQLFGDILINVTSFFRDSAAFATLQKKILPKIVKAKEPRGDIRIWVPGCSTGEEVYSIAIAVLEALGRQSSGIRVQIFGTDLSEQIVAKARTGVYSEAIAKDVGTARLRRFFTKTSSGNYQINRTVRDMCTFARQNVSEDAPFSRIDLITCRNVLIYLGPQLQKKCIPIFHYSLNPDGYLMLGTSESVGGFADLFALVDKKYKIYTKKVTALRPALDFDAGGLSTFPAELPEAAPERSERELDSELQKQIDRLILTRYAPNAVVVDEALQVLQFRGATSRYLEHAPGTASLDLLKMVRPPLVTELRTALHRAIKEDAAMRCDDVLLKINGDTLLVRIEVVPFRSDTPKGRLFLVTFEHRTQQPSKHASDGRRNLKREVGGADARTLMLEVQQLRDELSSTKESLQGIIEEREAANEELKSANEEVQSSNEELQSTNEELETAKEELQSANEELTTVNEELGNRNSELATVNNDLHNLLSSINIPIIIVDNELCVRRVTAPGEKIFNLIPNDVGRPLSNIKPNLDIPDLVPLIREVILTLSIREREVRDSENRWHQLRVRPYRTMDNKINGAIITLVEIDVMKRSLANLQSVVEFANSLLDSTREPMVVVGEDLVIRQANQAFRQQFKIARSDLENARIHRLGDNWNLPKVRAWLTGMNKSQQRTSELKIKHRFPLLGQLHLSFQAKRFRADGDHFILLAIKNIIAAKEGK
jgi:two-component system, chemotaxis family, CheB/CheR fusion protein